MGHCGKSEMFLFNPDPVPRVGDLAEVGKGEDHCKLAKSLAGDA